MEKAGLLGKCDGNLRNFSKIQLLIVHCIDCLSLFLSVRIGPRAGRMPAVSTSSQCLSPRTLTLMTRGQVLITRGLALTIHLHSWVPHMVTLMTQDGVLSPRALILMT